MTRKSMFSMDSLRSELDVFEAIKRAMLYNGFVRRKTGTKKEEKAEGSEELKGVTKKAHEILFRVDTVFPFTLFPDTVTLDREKLNIATRFFYRVAKVTSVPVRDILSVETDVGPFFGSIHMTSRYFSSNPYSVNFLWRDHAMRLQNLLQGYIIAHEREIDCASIEKGQLMTLLNDLGTGAVD